MSAESLIESYINTLTSHKEDLLSQATQLAEEASSAVYGYVKPGHDIKGYKDFRVTHAIAAGPDESDTQDDVSTEISLDFDSINPDIDISVSDFPDAPSLESDDLDTPDGPSQKVTAFKGTVPNIDDSFDNIATPDISQFEPLEFLPLTFPDTNIDAQVPVFDATRPVFLGQDDYDLDGTIDNKFTEALADIRSVGEGKLDAFLAEHFPDYQNQISTLDDYLDDVINGRTTSWALQDTIYNKRRTQTEAEKGRLDEEYARNAARRGSVIDLALQAATIRLQQAAHDANVVAAYEVAEQKADREQRHLEVVLNLLASLRQAALQAWLAYNDIMLREYAEAREQAQLLLTATVQAHNLAVQRYNADIELYKADAQVYEVELRSALVEYELLKVELEVLQATNDANDSIVKQRLSELEAEKLKIELYAEQVKAQASTFQLRRLPLEVFETRIKAHMAYLESRQTEAQIFEALVRGNSEVSQRDLARARIYAEEAAGWKARVDAEVAKKDIEVKINDQKVKQALAEVAAKRAEIEANDSYNRSQAELTRQAIAVWQEQERLELQNAMRNSDDARAQQRARIEYDRIITEYSVAFLNYGLQRAKAIADVNNDAAATVGDLAAAAMAANGSNLALINQTSQ